MEDRIYFRELPCYEKAEKTGKKLQNPNGYFDLLKLPERKMRDEMRSFILTRASQVSHTTICSEQRFYSQACIFISETNVGKITSILDKTQEKWIQMLKGWMLKNGKSLTYEKKTVYGNISVVDVRLIQYFKRLLAFLQPKDEREETEKDIWRLAALDIKIKENSIYNVETLDFRKIHQPDIREEVKKVIYLNLQYEAIGTVQGEMTAIRKFSKYLKNEHPKITSCLEIDRDVWEGFLINLNTEASSHRSNRVLKIRNVLEGVGKLYGCSNLENLFLNTDIPPEIQPEFKNYSDEEVKRLNAHITKLDEQIARCLVIHQMLGTRISDTLTLECDCLYMENQQHMICIHQVKTHTYRKPISTELAQLIQRAIDYTIENYGESRYIFVNAQNVSRPMQYTTIKHKIMGMIQRENLLDDEGKLFQFSTHMFRHYYGVKLTGLSRGSFYKNPTIRQEMDRAMEQQAGMIDPRRDTEHGAGETEHAAPTADHQTEKRNRRFEERK